MIETCLCFWLGSEVATVQRIGLARARCRWVGGGRWRGLRGGCGGGCRRRRNGGHGRWQGGAGGCNGGGRWRLVDDRQIDRGRGLQDERSKEHGQNSGHS